MVGYMAKLKTAKIVPMVTIVLAVAVIVAVVFTVLRLIFFSGNSSETTSSISTSREELLDSTADRSVKMIVRGKIVADEDFQEYRIEVSPSTRRLIVNKGYIENPTIIETKTNNIPAYKQFVNALDKANLANGADFSGQNNDLLGICATGRVYEFQMLKNNAVIKQYWTSTCAGSPGSLEANIEQVSNLFYAQIPGSKLIISKLWQ